MLKISRNSLGPRRKNVYSSDCFYVVTRPCEPNNFNKGLEEEMGLREGSLDYQPFPAHHGLGHKNSDTMALKKVGQPIPLSISICGLPMLPADNIT